MWVAAAPCQLGHNGLQRGYLLAPFRGMPHCRLQPTFCSFLPSSNLQPLEIPHLYLEVGLIISLCLLLSVRQVCKLNSVFLSREYHAGQDTRIYELQLMLSPYSPGFLPSQMQSLQWLRHLLPKCLLGLDAGLSGPGHGLPRPSALPRPMAFSFGRRFLLLFLALIQK